MEQPRYTNALIHETSPYLLQHAHNPVNWQPWGEKALNQAKTENKLLLISIGYSACHWCHVMEHESFEDLEVANIMNKNFICIKVDREERPDVDQIYMNAVQMLTGSGGWPLNCIALPDRRPIWGGTYFPKNSWMEALKTISKFYAENPEKSREYATKLQLGMEQNALIPISGENQKINPELILGMISNWRKRFDTQNGGTEGAPKFMLPNNWQFLLQAGTMLKDKKLLDQVSLSLKKMAFGGIYDQIGGGFARYSTDEIWKVPHFEKMLYDNGQLLSLYSLAYKANPETLYKQVVAETISFLKRDLLSPENGFYSSLDADSEGEEGKFYVWKKPELQEILGADFTLFGAYYNVSSAGYWEENQYILMRTENDSTFAARNNLSLQELQKKVANWKNLLLEVRNKRVKPSLDDKILTSWNAMTITGLMDSFNAFGRTEYLDLALTNARFLLQKVKTSDGRLLHSYKNKQAKIDGFLEDYAFVIEAFVAIFESTGISSWLDEAKNLVETAFRDFYDKDKNIFYFTASHQNDLISRTFEVNDNVIPASNSVMAKNLFRLSYLLDKPEFMTTAKKMLEVVASHMENYPSGYSNWAQLALSLTYSCFEVAITGQKAIGMLHEMQQSYLPQVIFCASDTQNDLPLLANRFVSGETLIYVCEEKTCKLPVKTVASAIQSILNFK